MGEAGDFKVGYTFKFDIDDKVVCPVTGETGIVQMCAIDDGRKPMYFVKGANSEKWWPERHLDLVSRTVDRGTISTTVEM